jgi:uncharacterized lipoprotein YmbA
MEYRYSLKRIYILSILLIPFLLSGCGGGGTPIRYYMIDPVGAISLRADNEVKLSIEIMDVNIPQYLERFNIATRGEGNQLFLSDFNQWGDNFRKNLLRTMASNLANLLSTNDIGTPINRSMSIPDYRINLHIEQFERNYDGYVTLICRWQIVTVGGTGTVETHKVELISPYTYAMDEYEGIVFSMKDLYGQLSKLIAESIISTDEELE